MLGSVARTKSQSPSLHVPAANRNTFLAMRVNAKMADVQSAIIAPELLDTLRSQADLPDDVWYLVAVTALCVLNRPEEIPAVYMHAVGKGHGSHGRQNGAGVSEQEQLRIARRIREALLKTSAIGGLPKVRTSEALAIGVETDPHSHARKNKERKEGRKTQDYENWPP